MSIRTTVRASEAYRYEARTHAAKLDQNEFPADLPAELRAELGAQLQAVALNRYPEIDAHTLRAALGRAHGWPAGGVVVAGGSNVLIQSLMIAAGIGRRVVTVAPTFSLYALQARLLGAALTEVPLGPRFELPVAQLERELARGDGGLLIIANPAAPTGNLHPLEELERLARAAGPEWLVVIDEAYRDFAGSDALPLAERPNVLSLRTFSKAFGLAGARIGYALMQPELAEQVQKTVLPFSVSALQTVIARFLLDRPELVRERVAAAVAGRERLAAGLAAHPGVLEVFPSVTNFVLFRVADAQATHRVLAERGVGVRRQDHLPGLAGCLRVSAGLPAENEAFLAALSEALPREAGRG